MRGVVLSQEGQLNNKGVCYRQENINFQQGNKYLCNMVLFSSIWTGLFLGAFRLSEKGWIVDYMYSAPQF